MVRVKRKPQKKRKDGKVIKIKFNLHMQRLLVDGDGNGIVIVCHRSSLC